jgi:hypothetical protein
VQSWRAPWTPFRSTHHCSVPVVYFGARHAVSVSGGCERLSGWRTAEIRCVVPVKSVGSTNRYRSVCLPFENTGNSGVLSLRCPAFFTRNVVCRFGGSPSVIRSVRPLRTRRGRPQVRVHSGRLDGLERVPSADSHADAGIHRVVNQEALGEPAPEIVGWDVVNGIVASRLGSTVCALFAARPDARSERSTSGSLGAMSSLHVFNTHAWNCVARVVYALTLSDTFSHRTIPAIACPTGFLSFATD